MCRSLEVSFRRETSDYYYRLLGLKSDRRKKMINQMDLGGSFTLPGTSMILRRMGYGAMQSAGPEVWGPPRDVDGAVAVLQEAVATGVNHIDTSDFMRVPM